MSGRARRLAVLSSAAAELELHERAIRDHVGGFVAVGCALLAIRDGRLYRDGGYETFEAYCRGRWDWSRSYAHRIIEASDVAVRMLPIGNVASESHARELAKLPPEQQADAWREAVETAPDGKVTAKHVASVVGPLLPPRQDAVPRMRSADEVLAELDATLRRVWDAWPKDDSRQGLEGLLSAWVRRCIARDEKERGQ